MSEDPIADKLGLTPMKLVSGEIVEEKSEVEQTTAERDLEADRTYARQNLYELIETNARALQEMIDVASQSQHPRAFEVVSTLIKTMAETNKDLVDLAEKRVPKQDREGPKEINNNLVFQGSTKDLLELLKNNKND